MRLYCMRRQTTEWVLVNCVIESGGTIHETSHLWHRRFRAGAVRDYLHHPGVGRTLGGDETLDFGFCLTEGDNFLETSLKFVKSIM